jgi:hypothetical protein
MANLARYTQTLVDLDAPFVYSHFMEAIGTRDWTSTVTDSGTIASGNTVNGNVVLTPADGTVADNDEAYLSSINQPFIFATNTSIYGRCKLKFTETTATIYNVGFGFMNAPGANMLIDDGGGPKVSGSTLAIVKVDGSGVWKCYSACNGTSTVSTSSGAGSAAVTATDYVLEIIANDWDGVSMEVAFKVDGVYLKDSAGATIKHTVAIASAAQMALWVGAKLGAATNNDTTTVDYIYGSQTLK